MNVFEFIAGALYVATVLLPGLDVLQEILAFGALGLGWCLAVFYYNAFVLEEWQTGDLR